LGTGESHLMSSVSSGMRAWLVAAGLVLISVPAHSQWDSYEKMSAESLRAALARPSNTAAPLTRKNFSNLDLQALDLRGAHRSACVCKGAKLMRGRLDRTSLTVTFREQADLSEASLQGAMLFSVQMAGSTLRHANLAGARLIGDLRRADLSGANLTQMNAAA